MSRGKGKISQELLHKIKDSVNLIDVVGEHVVLRKSGSNFTGLCPFHSERSPSFSVSENKQLYHCYGCNKGGDLLSFVMEIHGISFPEAIEELAERARIPLPQGWSGSNDPEAQEQRAAANQKQVLAYKLNRFVAAFYHQQLKSHAVTREYFKKRGLDPSGDLAKSFYLGSAPGGWDGLATHLEASKAPMPLAVELGLIRPSQRTSKPAGGSGYFDLFRGRAMFPILDMRGRVAGFGGRTLPSSSDAKAQESDGPKYLNSSESLVFQKSKLAFGLFQAQKHIREKGEVILVEGYFDVLGMHAGGFANTVATCGTSLTPEHLHLFQRFGKKIIVLFDGDKAGISATERAMEIGLEHGQILYGATLPLGLDPDEVLFDSKTGLPLADGKNQMAAVLSHAVPLLDARIDESIVEAATSPEARAQSLKRIGKWLAIYRDPVGREVRIQSVVDRMRISRDLLFKAMPGSPADSARPTQMNRPQGELRPKKPAALIKTLSTGDRVLFGALARGGADAELFAEVSAKLPPETSLSDLWEFGPARDFVAGIQAKPGGMQAFWAKPSQALDTEAGHLDPVIHSALTEALVGVGGGAPSHEIKVAIDRALGRLWARFSQHIKKAIAEAEAKKDAGLQSQLMKEYLDVQRKMKEFSSFYDQA